MERVPLPGPAAVPEQKERNVDPGLAGLSHARIKTIEIIVVEGIEIELASQPVDRRRRAGHAVVRSWTEKILALPARVPLLFPAPHPHEVMVVGDHEVDVGVVVE